MTYGLAAAVILLLITFSQYVTLRMENGHLKKKLDEQLSTAATNIHELENKIEANDNLYSSCTKAKGDCEESIGKLKLQLADRGRTVDDIRKELKETEKKETEMREEIRNLKSTIATLEEKNESLRQEKTAMQETLQKCESEKKEMAKNVKAEKPEESVNKNEAIKNYVVANDVGPRKKPSLVFEEGKPNVKEKEEDNAEEDQSTNDLKKPLSKKEILDAELPDVDPKNVKVERNDMKGNTYHKDENGNPLPIIVFDDPKATRAEPEHSVLKEIEKN